MIERSCLWGEAKYESFTDDSTFFGGDANVRGDNDEKYEDDFLIAVTPTAKRALNRRYGNGFVLRT